MRGAVLAGTQKHFSDAGFQVSAFDASTELAALASEYCGFQVAVRRFEEVTEFERYDGIWCCASLLHVPGEDLPGVLSKLWRALRPGGRIYVSFKHGTGERAHGGRNFTDADEDTVRALFGNLADVHDLAVWFTEDQRPDRSEQWTNALATRSGEPPRRLVTGGADHFLPHLSQAFSKATEADLAVAFVTQSGLRLLLPDLESMVDAGPPFRVRVLTSDYLGVTDLAHYGCCSFNRSAAQRCGFTQRRAIAFTSRPTSLRAWGGALVAGEAFIGSSNISRQALLGGLEWNYKVVHPGDSGFLESRRASRNCSHTRRACR
jgi:HKD family nuclease